MYLVKTVTTENTGCTRGKSQHFSSPSISPADQKHIPNWTMPWRAARLNLKIREALGVVFLMFHCTHTPPATGWEQHSPPRLTATHPRHWWEHCPGSAPHSCYLELTAHSSSEWGGSSRKVTGICLRDGSAWSKKGQQAQVTLRKFLKTLMHRKLLYKGTLYQCTNGSDANTSSISCWRPVFLLIPGALPIADK